MIGIAKYWGVAWRRDNYDGEKEKDAGKRSFLYTVVERSSTEGWNLLQVYWQSNIGFEEAWWIAIPLRPCEDPRRDYNGQYGPDSGAETGVLWEVGVSEKIHQELRRGG